MKILFTERSVEHVRQHHEDSEKSISELVAALEELSSRGVDGNPKVHCLRDVSEQIYVYRYKGFRVYLTKKSDALVVLSIEKANNSFKPKPLRGLA